MSERGAFTTEYIYCPKCFRAAKKVFLARNKYLCSVVIRGYGNNPMTRPLPIIAGKIGHTCAGGELIDMEYELAPKLAALICHPLRVAVLAETGERIFTIQPDNPE